VIPHDLQLLFFALEQRGSTDCNERAERPTSRQELCREEFIPV